jgi:hypothetical protein
MYCLAEAFVAMDHRNAEANFIYYYRESAFAERIGTVFTQAYAITTC